MLTLVLPQFSFFGGKIKIIRSHFPVVEFFHYLGEIMHLILLIFYFYDKYNVYRILGVLKVLDFYDIFIDQIFFSSYSI